MRKILLLFSIVVLIVIYVNLPIFDAEPTFRSNQEEVVQDDVDVIGEPITRGEINSFLKIWPDYENSWVSKLGVKQLSFTTSSNPDNRYSYLTKLWLNRRGWEVGRFFYVEQRLKAIVKSLEVEDRANKTTELLEEQLKIEKNAQVSENIKNLIEYQKSLLNIEKVTKQERDMVRPYFSEVEEILSSKSE